MEPRSYLAVMKSLFLLFLGMGFTVTAQNQRFPDCASGKLAENDVCNTALSPSERAAALVAVLTDDEKLQNLVS
jgi:beta-D-xylosidase 4